MGERPLIRRKESAALDTAPQLDAPSSEPQQPAPQQQHSLGGFQLPSQAQQQQTDCDAQSPFSALIRPGRGPDWKSAPQTTTATHQLVARIPMAAGASARTAPAGGAAQIDADTVEPGGADREEVDDKGGITVTESDAVGATLTYTPTIANSGTPGASEFGVTSTSTRINGITVAQDTTAHVFNVTAAVNNDITWSVHSLGRTDILNENAAAITKDNYTTVSSDLTPNMASDNGRPPRTQFWASDLTQRHEQFHANERAHTYGRPAFDFARTWLIAQTANSAADATTLAQQVPGKMRESYNASYAPGKESRAYGDGAPSYLARATAIRNKGQSNQYP